jgi:hypothetical protein
VVTGVDRLDGVLEQVGIVRLRWAEDRFVELGSDHAVASGNVIDALAGVDGLRLGFDDLRAVRKPYDLIDEGIDVTTGEHRVLFTIGWYECDVECAEQYFWRTAVAEDGSARLIEEWGNPIPEFVRASWYR